MTQEEMRVCDVHRAIDNDLTPRLCVWCNFCKAWICKEDLSRWDRRRIAAAKNWGRTVRNAVARATGCGGCGKSGLDK